jgi:predicted PurR-regulated permease PerM
VTAPVEEPTSNPPVQPLDAPMVTKKRLRFFVLWGAVALAVIFVFRAVLLPFFLAVVLAYVFAPIITAMTTARASGRALPRWVAVVILYISLLGTLGTLIGVGVPRLITEGQSLARDVPRAIAEVRSEWLPRFEAKMRAVLGERAMREAEAEAQTEPIPVVEGADVVTGAARDDRSAIQIIPDANGGYSVHLPPSGIVVTEDGDRLIVTEADDAVQEPEDLAGGFTDTMHELTTALRSHAGSLFAIVSGAVKTIVKPVFTFFITLMLSAYILITKDTIIGFFRVMVGAESKNRFDSLLRRIDKGLSGVIRGQLMICVVNGLLSGIGFYALGLRYWWLLTIIATVFSIIPIFGSILSTIPAVILGLRSGLTTGLLTLAWILIIHQIEANLLNPKIMGDSAKVHPVLVVFALLAGESVFGIAGALLAVPVLSITQSIFLHYRESALGIPAPKADRTVG